MVLRHTRRGTNGPLGHAALASTPLPASVGDRPPPIIGPLAQLTLCDIVAIANRIPEDQCVSRPNRSSSNANRPRKSKLDAQKRSIWGRRDEDIAQGLKDRREEDHAVATGGDNRD